MGHFDKFCGMVHRSMNDANIVQAKEMESVLFVCFPCQKVCEHDDIT